MLDLSDIQGNILRGYRSFPDACFLFFRVDRGDGGQAFLKALLDSGWITPGQWCEKPEATTNLAFTFEGLRALGLPVASLASFPPEFQEGMKSRAPVLGDTGQCAPNWWDEPWLGDAVHILVICYARVRDRLAAHCAAIRALVPEGVHELEPCQEAGLLSVNGKRTRKEHFGFDDGLSNPDVEGVPDDGGPGDTGNPDEQGSFHKIPVGEFILGYPSEGREMSSMPVPHALTRNGTYLVVRKLEQHVVRFRDFLRTQAAVLGAVPGIKLPSSPRAAEDFLAAKMFGRWPDGSSLDLYPAARAGDKSNNFNYADDPEGTRCPLGAHVRRANPRASLGFGGNIVRRRRLIRRGIAYGKYLSEAAIEADAGDRRGIMFLAFNASISQQFEFVQQQWINYGDDFNQGNDTDPIAGNRFGGGRMVVPDQPFRRVENGVGRMVIPGDQRTARQSFLCADIPCFVTTKGGDYFFVPSLTGIRLIAAEEVCVP
jgi:Dyp-type peroxidase family